MQLQVEEMYQINHILSTLTVQTNFIVRYSAIIERDNEQKNTLFYILSDEIGEAGRLSF
jgi:hypothetical protein